MKGIAAVLLLLSIAPFSWSQSTNQGAITGTVTDPTGAMIPGVSIIVVNTDTGVTRKTTSNKEGNYTVGFLTSGHYSATAETNGFKTMTTTGLVLTVGQLLRVDIHMIIGDLKQDVTVTSNAAPLNVDTPELGDVISEQSTQNLPLNGREWIGLAALVPGVSSGSPKTGMVYSKGYSIAVNGARASENGYTVDGADSVDPLYNQLITSPPLDGIQEFRVHTNAYSAEYGRAAGANISAVTKSGTNRFHGTVYEYYRAKVLDALPLFSNTTKADLPNYLFHQYGASLGGPIKKDKTFFFFGIERFYNMKPGSLFVTWSPTDEERNGNFCDSINRFTGGPVVLKNPFNQVQIPGAPEGNTDSEPLGSCVIPANLINANGKKIMDMIPEPNTFNPDDPLHNLTFFRGGQFRQKKYLTRIDHKLSNKDMLFGTFSFGNYDNSNPGETKYADTVQQDHDRTVTVTYTHLFSSSMVNNLNISKTWYLSRSGALLGDKNYANLDWGLTEQIQRANGTPAAAVLSGNDQSFTLGSGGDYAHRTRNLNIKDTLEWIKGPHSLHIGGDLRLQAYNWIYDSGAGQIYFGLNDGATTGQNVWGMAGNPWADLLMYVSALPYTYIGDGSYMPFNRSSGSVFLQDDWKVKPRFTMSLGLRYDYEGPWESQGPFLSFNWKLAEPQWSKNSPPSELAKLDYNFARNGPNSSYPANALNFAPRVGFAFRPFSGDRTVLRVGYGIFYDSLQSLDVSYGSWSPPYQGALVTYTKPVRWPDFQSRIKPLDQDPFSQADIDSKLGGNPTLYANAQHWPASYNQQWNLSVGQDLGWNTKFELAYVGSHGTNLSGLLSDGIATVAPDVCDKSKVINPPTGFCGWLWEKGFNSTYNSLQASAHREFSNGASFLAAYTWSHSMAQASQDDDYTDVIMNQNIEGRSFDRRWANSDFDVRHRFSLASHYPLPFGRGQQFGSNWHPVIDGILGGWQLDGIVQLQSGFPFTVRSANGTLPDRVCNGNLPSGQRTRDKWFDYTCFVDHPPTVTTDPTGMQILTNTNGNAGLNLITGPGTNNWDLSVAKTFPLKLENTQLQFRGEFFNAFNHANLTAPAGNQFYNNSGGAIIYRGRDNREIQLSVKLKF